MKRLTHHIVLLTIALSIASCGQAVGISPTPTQNIPVQKDTQVFSQTPSYTLMTLPAFSETPTPPIDLGSENIFISMRNGEFLVYNIDTQQAVSIYLPTECSVLPSGRSALCSGDQGAYLYDLEKRTMTMLLQKSTQHFGGLSHDQSKYYYWEDGSTDWFSVDFVSQTVRRFAAIDYGDRDLGPYISTDQRYIFWNVTHESSTILRTYDTESGQYITINPGVGNITDLEWSPRDSIIAIGSTTLADTPLESMGFDITYVSTYNADTGETKLITRAPNQENYVSFSSYARNIWSPDGTQLALISGQSVCAIKIIDLSKSCIDDKGKRAGITFTIVWSPDSKYLAYIEIGSKLVLHIVSADNLSNVIVEKNVPGNWVEDLLWTNP
jgi:hypothetical protein